MYLEKQKFIFVNSHHPALWHWTLWMSSTTVKQRRIRRGHIQQNKLYNLALLLRLALVLRWTVLNLIIIHTLFPWNPGIFNKMNWIMFPMPIKQTDQASVFFGFTISGFGGKRESIGGLFFIFYFFLDDSILDFA